MDTSTDGLQQQDWSAEAEALLSQAADLYDQRILQFQMGRLSVEDYFRFADYLLITAESLETGIHRWADAILHLGTGIEPKFERGSSDAELSFAGCNQPPAWLQTLLYLLHLRLCQSNQPISWQLRLPQGTFKALPPLELPRLPVFRSEAGCVLSIPSHLLNTPCRAQAPSIQHTLGQLAEIIRPELSLQRDWLDHVKGWIDRTLPQPVVLNEVASALNLGPRTLQRRLAAHDTSFKAVVDEVRYARATRLLAQPELTLKEIAHQIGFAEQSSFQRAFQSWHGCPPGVYRQRIRRNAVAAQSDWPVVSLYFAESHNQTNNDYARRGNQIWVLVKNVAFEKELDIVCEDVDGIWRHDRATFERFYCPGWELWSSPNLPVAEPFHFYIEYRCGGRVYVDNNQGHNYQLLLSQRHLLGNTEIVNRELGMFPLEPSGPTLLGHCYSRKQAGARLTLLLNGRDGLQQEVAAMPVPGEGDSVQCWRYQIPISAELRNYHIRLYTATACYIDDGGPQGFVPRRLD